MGISGRHANAVQNAITTSIMIAASTAIACGFQLLLIPGELLSGGLSGVAILIGYASRWNIGLLYLILNIPVLLWGWYALGRRFILNSVICVVATSLLMQIIPLYPATSEPMLAAIFGGGLLGVGTAVALRYGGSSGGFDIVASIISRRRALPVGLLIFVLNTLVVVALGVLNGNWDAVLYSMLSVFVTGKVIDSVHTPHRKVTAFIVTNHSLEMAAELLKLPRGVTIMKTVGAFTQEHRDLLMTVTTRYELSELRKLVQGVDRKAFVNIVQTIDVIGEFRKS